MEIHTTSYKEKSRDKEQICIICLEELKEEEYIGKTTVAQQWAEALYDPKTKMTEDQIPTEYQRHAKVFSEEASTVMPPRREFDHEIRLTADAPPCINCKVYPLKEGELQALRKDVQKGRKENKYKD